MSQNQELEAITPRMHQVSPEYAEIMMLGNVLYQSGYFSDIRDQAQAVTKILFGRELGFSPIVSITGIHIIEGKPALSSNLMATLIKRSGKYDYRVTEWSEVRCIITFREKTDGQWEKVGESSFSIEDATRAGIKFKTANGYPTSWGKFPKAMLFARAISQGLRTYCPDVSASPIYVPEEMGAEVDEEGAVVAPKGSATAQNEVLNRKLREIELQELADERAAKQAKEYQALRDHATLRNSTESAPVTRSTGLEPVSAEDATKLRTVLVASIDPAAGLERSNAEAASSIATASPAVGSVQFIEKNQQVNFRRTCKDALDKEKYPTISDRDAKIDQWLLEHGYYDQDGNTRIPTTSRIAANHFMAAREACKTWCEKQ